MKRYKEVQAPVVNTESRSRSAPHSTCNWRRMTTMAWVKRFARRIKHKSVRLQTFRRCLPAQNQLADLSELPQHSATHHKHTHQVGIAQSMYPLEKSRFKWETTKVRLHLSAMLQRLNFSLRLVHFYTALQLPSQNVYIDSVLHLAGIFLPFTQELTMTADLG